MNYHFGGFDSILSFFVIILVFSLSVSFTLSLHYVHIVSATTFFVVVCDQLTCFACVCVSDVRACACVYIYVCVFLLLIAQWINFFNFNSSGYIHRTHTHTIRPKCNSNLLYFILFNLQFWLSFNPIFDKFIYLFSFVDFSPFSLKLISKLLVNWARCVNILPWWIHTKRTMAHIIYTHTFSIRARMKGLTRVWLKSFFNSNKAEFKSKQEKKTKAAATSKKIVCKKRDTFIRTLKHLYIYNKVH